MKKTSNNKTYSNKDYHELVMNLLMKNGESFTFDGVQWNFTLDYVYLLRAWQRDYSFILVYKAANATETYFKTTLTKFETLIKTKFKKFMSDYLGEKIIMLSVVDIHSYHTALKQKWENHADIEIINHLSRESYNKIASGNKA
jgi:hypothetical protein